MSQTDTMERWRLCEEARLAALKNTNQDRDAHYRAQSAAAKIWNEWAEELIEARQILAAQGIFKLDKFTYERGGYIAPETVAANDATARWLEQARVDFGGTAFERRADFTGFIFPGQAIFGESQKYSLYTRRTSPKTPTTFLGGARFNSAIFHLDAVFDWAVFHTTAGFDHAHFYDIARFNQCVFEAITWFHHAIFEDDLWMGQVKFKAYTDFSEAQFRRSSFYAIQSEGAFLLTDTFFHTVPDFTQARFQGIPRIDGNVIPSMKFLPKLNRSQARQLQSRYLAIRQLAVAGHDHQSEAKAFKAEMRAKRGTDHRWSSALFWFSLAYDALSDFGQSMMRPFWLWASSILVFSTIYLAHASKLASWSGLCMDGSPFWLKALVFALKNALLFISWDREQIRSAYLCLYDLPHSTPDPSVPATHALIQAAQSAWSAVVIFMFLLAVRNQFKIK
jgi:hypothetical protein